MGSSIKSIRDVAEKHLCCGCGVCAYMQPDDISMMDVLDQGRRPSVRSEGGRDLDTDIALAVCPGLELGHEDSAGEGCLPELYPEWGPVLELWEGYAADDEVRFKGSSGGAATALALHCLEHEGMHGALHIAAREDVPYLNETVLSTTRAEMVATTGSRYAPASPCDGLAEIENAPAPCVFIGKPCDVAGSRKARALRPALDEKLGLTIAVFCAGTPSTQGTLEMIAKMGFEEPSAVAEVRYRGKGWPGHAEVSGQSGGEDRTTRLTYDESWGKILQKHRQWRCYVCADHTGEFADIAVGDPWYRDIPADEAGRSLVLVRTERGRRILQAAIESGVLVLERVGSEILPASQPNLLSTRGAILGRILTMRLTGCAWPRFTNMRMFGAFRRNLTLKQKAQSFYGTLKRVFTKGLYKRSPGVPYEPPVSSGARDNSALHGVSSGSRDSASP